MILSLLVKEFQLFIKLSFQSPDLPLKLIDLSHILHLYGLDFLDLVPNGSLREFVDLLISSKHVVESSLSVSRSFQPVPHLVQHNPERDEIEEKEFCEPFNTFGESRVLLNRW